MKNRERATLRAWGLFVSTLSGCTLALDFDDLEDLPCDSASECLPEFVCLQASNTCVRRGSVDPYKACSEDTVSGGNELCRDPDPTDQQEMVCRAINGQGPRCLETCTPTTYATPEAALTVADQCPVGRTCWPVGDGTGVCSDGVCSPNPNSCDPGEECIVFNGAGVCFTTCGPYQVNPFPCGANQLCHPIGDRSVTACIPAGERTLYEICSAVDMCQKIDGSTQQRPMVCDRELNSSAPRRCYAICSNQGDCNPPSEACRIARPNIDPDLGIDLNVCIGGAG